MSVQDTVFNRITRENEDVTTDLLVNLMHKKFFRDTCLKWLLKDSNINIESELNNIESSNINTQQSYSNLGCRPDIVIETSNIYVIIENKIKINTELQETQTGTGKNTYIGLLESKETNESKKTALVFLLPQRYDTQPIEELIKKIDEKNTELQKLHKYIFINFWNDFTQFLYSQDFDKINETYKDALEYFNSVIDNNITYKTNFTPYEVALMYNPMDILESFNLKETFKNITEEINDKLINSLKEKGIEGFSVGENTWDEQYFPNFGRFIYYKNDKNLWYGFNLLLLESDPDKEDCVFCLGIRKNILDSNKIKGKESSLEYFQIKNDDAWEYFKLKIKSLLSNEKNHAALVKDIVEKINRILK